MAEESGVAGGSGEVRANPGYALGRLAKAFAAHESHEDPEVRRRAEGKIARWIEVLEGMFSGFLRIGSRTPVADVPAWATLEVIEGGFATGALAAGGPLLPHEEEILVRLPASPPGSKRAAIHRHYLSDEGIAELQGMLAGGCYRIDVPEEAALLVIARLLELGLAGRARALLDAIAPWLDRLRFHPVPAPRPPEMGSAVRLQDVGRTVRDLKAMRVRLPRRKEREAIRVWNPLCDRIAALFAETVDGPLPSLLTGPGGKPLRDGDGRFHIEGGWPCQRYPEGWREKAAAALKDYRRLRREHKLCRKPDRGSENFPVLREALEKCLDAPRRLTGREVGRIRLILAAIAAKRGLPGSSRCNDLREAQARQASLPTPAELAGVLAGRLSRLPQEGGLEPRSLEAALEPVTGEEAARTGMPGGHPFGGRLAAMVARSLEGPMEDLVGRGIIPSGEVLARVLPPMTAGVAGAAISDPALRLLHGAIYRAFARRRSLLLLDLESQVKMEELPWVKEIEAFRKDDAGTREMARRILERVVVTALTAFPHQILPNKLLREIRSLAGAAGLRVPIVDEVAADIFMGEFSEKYLLAAKEAAGILEGTLYERYYGISYADVRRIDDVEPSRFVAPTSPAFIRMCRERAGAGSGEGSSPARNGTIIEQEQILTTHNLAALYVRLDLSATIRPRLGELARACFDRICRRLQEKTDAWGARLRAVKNSAYAWRQMVFFLSLLPDGEVEAFLSWAGDRLAGQRTGFRERFQPALRGLSMAARGEPPRGDAPAFLGWTTGRHWLLEK